MDNFFSGLSAFASRVIHFCCGVIVIGSFDGYKASKKKTAKKSTTRRTR
jgi:hypothetical protein